MKSLGICSGDLLWVSIKRGEADQQAKDCIMHEAEPHPEAPPDSYRVLGVVGVSGPPSSSDSNTVTSTASWEWFAGAMHAAFACAGMVPIQVWGNSLYLFPQTVYLFWLHYSPSHCHVQAGISGNMTGQEIIYALAASLNAGKAAHATCRTRYIGLGASLAAWGKTSSGTMHRFSISAADFGRSSETAAAWTSHDHGSLASDASIRLLDSFINPILSALCVEDGRPPPPCIQTLPTELKLLILRHLQVRLKRYSVLLLSCTSELHEWPIGSCAFHDADSFACMQAKSLAVACCVSRELRQLASSDALWEPLYEAEFGRPMPSQGLLAGVGGFKHAFGERWAERQRRRRRRLQRHHNPLPYPGSGPQLVVPHPFFPPGIVGGDYDRLPAPFLNFSGRGGSPSLGAYMPSRGRSMPGKRAGWGGLG